MSKHDELMAFLKGLNTRVAIVTSNANDNAFETIKMAYPDASSFGIHLQDSTRTMVNGLEYAFEKLGEAGFATVVVDVLATDPSMLTQRYAKASYFDSVLREFADGTRNMGSIERVILHSAVNEFLMAPETMKYIQVFNM